MPPNTKRYDADLGRFCQDLAAVAETTGATNAVLINANRVRLNVGIPRGGTVLLLRFPAAAVGRDEQPLQDLLNAHQPKPVYTVHAAPERPDGASQGPAHPTGELPQ